MEPWMDEAICPTVDPEIFFPERGSSAREGKSICRGGPDRPPCPVRAECLQYAMDTGQRYGIFGGFSERERRALRHGQDCICAGCQQVWERIARGVA